MGKKIIFLPEAEADLDEAAEFYEIQEPGLGDEVFDFLSARIDDLVTTGGLHSFSRGAHRAVVLGRFPYFTIHYRNDPSTITVLAVLDQRRDPEHNLNKLRSRI
ncbi:type II toxin-antitoxin system RelE/ParE family toxin [Prosthecobacter algae]|uniref:type II toxin-antitoxin system RelE/ParE family toxin n=1 Tax=Prosthecobacter algae TaxID=1144682 RepID=UPI0031F1AAF2